MIREIIDGFVDTSIAGFVHDLSRNNVVDFSPALFRSIRTIIIRKPSKRDFHIRYFTLEFTNDSWILIILLYLFIIGSFGLILKILFRYELELLRLKSSHKAWLKSLDICFNAFINKVCICSI